MNWYFWVILIAFVLIGCFVSSCSAMSGIISRDEREKEYEELAKQNQSTVLSDLEKSSVDKLKKQIEII